MLECQVCELVEKYRARKYHARKYHARLQKQLVSHKVHLINGMQKVVLVRFLQSITNVLLNYSIR